MMSADCSTAMDALQHTALRRAQHLTSNLTDACCANLIINGVSEGTCACLNNVNDARSIAVVFELQVLLME